jgi:hypothetical protein
VLIAGVFSAAAIALDKEEAEKATNRIIGIASDV